jgi:Leucine-rich repeat (LRR) protein
MENYTSDSSDSDSHTIDYQNRNLTVSKLEDNFLNLYKTESAYGDIETIILYNNQLSSMPLSLVKFHNLNTLDISNNYLTTLNIEMFVQCPLRTLIAKNNLLTNESLPKAFMSKTGGQLRELNLSGNQLTTFPDQVLELKSIKYLYLNGNLIKKIHKDIWKMKK